MGKKTEYVSLRFEAAFKELCRKAAKSDGRTLANWLEKLAQAELKKLKLL
jgi:hypothetical protein